MTTSGGAGTTLYHFPLRAPRTGFSHRVGASRAIELRPFAFSGWALRGTSGGASMTTPGAPGTTPLPGVLRPIARGAPASIIGSELLQIRRHRAPTLHFARLCIA